MTRDTEDVVVWNQVVDLILEWEDSDEMDNQTAGALARKIIQCVRASDRQSLSDRIDVLTQALKPFADKATFIEQARETWKPSLGPIGDGYTVAISLGKLRNARAALHQEGIATVSGRNPATHEPSPVPRSRP